MNGQSDTAVRVVWGGTSDWHRSVSFDRETGIHTTACGQHYGSRHQVVEVTDDTDRVQRLAAACPGCYPRGRQGRLVADGGQTEPNPTRVGHVEHDEEEIDVYVGRGPDGRDMLSTPEIGDRGWLGNPFTTDEFKRGPAVHAFRVAFESLLEGDREFRLAVRDLAGQTLGCWCQTLAESGPECHAEVIAEHADRLTREEFGTQSTLCDGGEP